MKFFIDTANLDQIKEMQDLGIIDGVTTNPTLLSREGAEPREQLKSEGIKTNVTLVFSQNQVLIAAKAGASYISPFIGRLMDSGQNEIDMLWESMNIINAYDFESEIIVASVRNTRHVIEAAKMGAHIATIPFDVLEKMFKHPRTDQGLEAFLKDWEKLQNQLKNK
ncbi:MAG: transaldolase family protein [Candidatus Lokiarchaeota archaeon]